jgi:hypothetical protein
MATAPDLRDGERQSAARARWAVALLGCGAALDVLAIVAGLSRLGFLGGPAAASAGVAGDEALLRLALVQLAVFALAAIAWLAWLHGAYLNLKAMGTGRPGTSRGWRSSTGSRRSSN